MKPKSKRFVAMIMTVAMMTSLFPAAGFAAEMQPAGNVEATVTEPATNDNETTPIPTADQTVADWDGLKSAIEAAQEATTIQLPAALESDETITLPAGAEITLVGAEGGTTITRQGNNGEFIVNNDASLTLNGNITVSARISSDELQYLTTTDSFQIAGKMTINGKLMARTSEDFFNGRQGAASFIDCTGELVMNSESEVSGWTINTLGGDGNKAGAAIKVDGEQASFIMNGGTITNCSNSHANAAVSPAIQVLNGATITMENGSLTKNGNNRGTTSQGTSGGAIYVGEGSHCTINGGILSENAGSLGGAIYVGKNATLNINEDVSLTQNIGSTGGAIYGKDAQIILTGVTLSDNILQWQYGSAIAVDGGTLTLDGCDVTGNITQNGTNQGRGAIYSDESTLEIKNTNILQNDALGEGSNGKFGVRYGGGITLNDGTATLTNTTISENRAMAGAGIFSDGCNLTINSCKITNNDGTQGSVDMPSWFQGGGMYLENGAVTITGTEIDPTIISGNKSRFIGGGIYASLKNGTLDLSDNIIIKDNSAVSGGGVFSDGTTTLTLNGAEISDNHAVYSDNYNGSSTAAYNGHGGGITVNGSTFTMNSGSVITNEATNYAGGIFNLGEVKLIDGLISGNAGYEAGALLNYPDASVTMQGGTITNNSAELAGGIENAGTFTLQGGTIAGNKATGDDVNANEGIGGGIVNTGTFTQTGGKIYGNIAKTGADDFYNFADTSTTGTFTLLDPSTFGVGADKWYEDAPNDRYTSGGDNASYESFTANTESHYLTLGLGDVLNTITVTPADITIYMGGTDGYAGVVDEDGTITGSNSLPDPGFTVTLPEALKDVPVTELTFKEANDASDKTWKFVPYDGNPATTVYKLVPQGEGQEATRVEFTNGSETITSDAFDVGENVNTTYTMSLYKGDGESAVGDIVTEYEGKTYSVDSSATATLTVRGTTDEPQLATVGTTPEKGKPAVSAPEGTTYAINGGNVAVQNPAGVSLLFDDIIDTNSENRTDLLKKKANEKLGGDASDRNMEIKYLDLVDAHNGNAWVKASQNVTIYWPIPEGASAEDSFKVLHFENLHRDMQSTNIESAITNCTVTEVPCTVEGDHITFQMGEDGFSPFALVWEEKSEPSWPDWPDWPPVGPGDDDDDNDDGDDNDNPPILNTEDHFSYVVGYEDGMVKPQRSITRAEVATIFYRLLEDDVRDDYDTTRNNFSDVTSDSWYNQTVSTLASMGILKGYEDGTFRPNASITRAEFAAIATRFFEETGVTYEPGTFTDVTGSEWFAGAIMDAVNLGLIGGYEDGTVRPNNNITRAEACAIVNRTLGRVPDADHLLPADEMTTWPDNPSSAWFYADMQEATNGHEYEWITEDGNKIEEWTDILDKDWNDR